MPVAPGRPNPATLVAPKGACPAKVAHTLGLSPTCHPIKAQAQRSMGVKLPPGKSACAVPSGKRAPAKAGTCSGALPAKVSGPRALRWSKTPRAPTRLSPVPGTTAGGTSTNSPAGRSASTVAPQASSSNGYAAGLEATSYYMFPGAISILVAFSNVDIGPTPYYLEIYDSDNNALVAVCGSGTYCEVEVSVPVGAPQAYTPVRADFVAVIASYSPTYPPPNLVASSNEVTLDWDLAELSGPSNPVESPVSCETTWGVNCATGNFYRSYPELAVPGRGVPLSFSLTYNSETPGPAGALVGRWTDNYNMVLVSNFDGAGGALIYQANSSTAPFYGNGVGGFSPYPQVHASLVAGPGGTYVFSPRGGLISYVFNSSGQLIQEVDSHGYVTTLSYGNGLLGSELTSVTDPEGRSLDFYYNAIGPELGVGQLALVIDPSGAEVAIYYGLSTYGDALELTNLVAYNNQTSLTSFAYTSAADPSHLTGIVDPNGTSLAIAYDCPGTCTAGSGRNESFLYSYAGTTATSAIIDPDANVTIATHNDYLLSSLTRGYGSPAQATWDYGFDPYTHQVSSVTDPLGRTSSATYDSAGDLASATDPTGAASTYTYNTSGQVVSLTDPDGHQTSYSYDPAGDLTSITQGASATTLSYAAAPGDLTSVTNPDGHTTTYTYDPVGNLATVTDPVGDTTTYSYDGEGRVVGVTSPLGHQSSYTYAGVDPGVVTAASDGLGNTTTYTYDADNNLSAVSDPSGATTTYSYDGFDELSAVNGPNGQTQTTTYDPNGNVLSVGDASGTQWSYGYDALGRRISATDAANRTSSYAYDAAGQLSSVTDPQGHTTTYTYDGDGRVNATTYSDGVTPDTTYSYDPNGNLLAMTDGTGSATYAYNDLGALVSQRNGQGATVSYGYDPAGNLTRLTYPDGRVVTRSYDPAGRLVGVSDGQGHTTTFAYDADSNLVTQAYPNATTASFGYDPNDNTTQIADTGPNGAFVSLGYSRDARGLLASVNGSTYGYDASGRLTSAPGSQAYAYDSSNDPTTIGGPSTTATLSYGPAHELDNLNTGLLGPNTTFTYTALGQRSEASTTTNGLLSSTQAYTWNSAGELSGYSGPSTAASYSYDGTGLRMSKTVNGVSQNYVWDQAEGQPQMLVDGSTDYIYGPGGAALEQVTAGGQTYYYHQDQLGSTVALTNSAGGVVATYAYDPYGNLASSTGSLANPLLYAGAYQDSESGLYALGVRMYDPATAAFISVDPLAALTGAPYAYGGDSPANATDASGLCAASAQAGGTGAAVVIDPLAPGLSGAAEPSAPNPTANLVDEVFGGAAVLGNQVVLGTAPAKTAIIRGKPGGSGGGDGEECQITVRHYTNNSGRKQIQSSGGLRAGTFVTRPEEIPRGASSKEIERLLEIDEGKGTHYIDIQVPCNSLGIPENGPITSGGVWQRILLGPVDLGGGEFIP
ncbi:MAG: RHS repeat-associated core domain-containing protein [Acidimicrobiales bacterium]